MVDSVFSISNSNAAQFALHQAHRTWITMAAAASFCALIVGVGCSNPQKEPAAAVPSDSVVTASTAAPSTSSRDAPKASVLPAQEESGCGPMPAYAVSTSPQSKTIATPAWPTSTAPLRLTWVAHKAGPSKPNGEPSGHPVELLISQGTVTRRVNLGQGVGSTWAGAPVDHCPERTQPKAIVADSHGELSGLDFEYGGTQRFFARLVKPGTLQVAVASMSDGMCGDRDISRTELAQIPVPDHATFEDQFRLEDTHGRTMADPCAPMSAAPAAKK